MLRNLQFAREDSEPIMAQPFRGGGSTFGSGAAFNALRSELAAPVSPGLNAPSIAPAPTSFRPEPATAGFAGPATLSAPAPSPIVTTLRAEPAPIPAPVVVPTFAPAPAPVMTMTAPPVAAPAPVAAPVPAPNPALASSRRFKDFLAVNPQFGTGSAADLISAYQQWTGQAGGSILPSAPTGIPTSIPPLIGAVNSTAPAAPQSGNHLQNFYETHGYYPGQGGL